jgi:hypothetical protein
MQMLVKKRHNTIFRATEGAQSATMVTSLNTYNYTSADYRVMPERNLNSLTTLALNRDL